MSGMLNSKNDQKIISFLLGDPGRQYLAAEIQKATGLSKGGVNLSLRKSVKRGLVNRQKRGNVYLYSVNHLNPVCKQLKVVKTVESIMPIIKKISEKAEKVILFGSAARGENVKESDVDLMVISSHPKEEVEKKILGGLRSREKFQVIIQDPVVFEEMEKDDPVFHEEVLRGITLWERKS